MIRLFTIKREILFFFVGLVLFAITVSGAIMSISFLMKTTKGALESGSSKTPPATYFDIKGLKDLGIIPR